MELTITGTIQDGKLILDQEPLDLPSGRVKVTIHTESLSSSLEEAKAWLQNPPELTPEREKIIKALYASHKQIATDTGPSDDFADNLDEYLYF